jgi:hypothetical protein
LLGLGSVQDDGAVDMFNASSGQTWILAGSNDLVQSRNRDTVVDVV